MISKHSNALRGSAGICFEAGVLTSGKARECTWGEHRAHGETAPGSRRLAGHGSRHIGCGENVHPTAGLGLHKGPALSETPIIKGRHTSGQ